MPHTVSAVGRQRETDRPDAAVEIPDRLVTGELRRLARKPVQLLGHGRVRLQERVRPDAEAQAAELLLDPASPQRSSLGRFVTSAGLSLIDQCTERTCGKRRTTSTR